MSKPKSGFTVVELLLVISILAVFFGIASINLVRTQRKSSIDASRSVLITDLRHQQLKAMSGDTSGELGNQDYGIYFSQNSYTLFVGSSYDSNHPLNFEILLDEQLSFTTSLVDSQIIFEKGSGEFVGFLPGSDSITMTDATNANVVEILVNSFGVPFL